MHVLSVIQKRFEEMRDEHLSAAVCIPQVPHSLPCCAFASRIPDILLLTCESAKKREKTHPDQMVAP